MCHYGTMLIVTIICKSEGVRGYCIFSIFKDKFLCVFLCVCLSVCPVHLKWGIRTVRTKNMSEAFFASLYANLFTNGVDHLRVARISKFIFS